MMDDQVFQLIMHKFDALERKVDLLLEFKWKIAGMAIVAGILSGAVFEFVVRVVLKA